MNGFEKFFVTIGHGIEDIFKWAPTIGRDIGVIVERLHEEEQLNPQFLDGLKSFSEAGASLVAAAGTAVAQKGLNPMQDIATLEALETFVKSFAAFYPIIQEGIQIIEGKVPQTPVPVTDPGPASVADVIETATDAPADAKKEVSDVEEATQPIVDAIKTKIKTFTPANTQK